jgi:phosphoserine phosphatase RsbU/P
VRTLGRRPLMDVVSDTVAEAVRWQGHDQFPDDVALMAVEIKGETRSDGDVKRET